jgi:stage V sporulation protein T
LEEKVLKATGIVRRIDDLGRIVIPKEIRRTLRIRESDPLLTSLTVSANADKQGVCEDLQVVKKQEAALLEERIRQVRRELFVGGVIGLAERTGKS